MPEATRNWSEPMCDVEFEPLADVIARLMNSLASDAAMTKGAFSSEAQPHPLSRARRDSVTGLFRRVERAPGLTPAAAPRTDQNPDSNPRDPHTWEPPGIARLSRAALERANGAELNKGAVFNRPRFAAPGGGEATVQMFPCTA